MIKIQTKKSQKWRSQDFGSELMDIWYYLLIFTSSPKVGLASSHSEVMKTSGIEASVLWSRLNGHMVLPGNFHKFLKGRYKLVS